MIAPRSMRTSIVVGKIIPAEISILESPVSITAYFPASLLYPITLPVFGSITSIPCYLSTCLIYQVFKNPPTIEAIIADIELKRSSLAPIIVFVLYSTDFLIPRATKTEEAVAHV